MRHKILLIGFGMQGRAALFDLVRWGGASGIVVADSRPELPAELSAYSSDRVRGVILDALDEASLGALMGEADVVIEALPGSFALPLGRLAVAHGVSLVSSMYYLSPGEEDPARIQAARDEIRTIDLEARAKGITILTEFGLDPGLDLVLGARAVGEMDEVREFRTYGAGLPAPTVPPNPLRYKFSWSVVGVMRSYRRPARIIANGQAMKIDAARVFEAENCHRLDVPEIGGPLECFPNGDAVHYAELFGIRSSLRESGRYTCRCPGHCAFWDVMVKSGFLDDRVVRVAGASVSPLEFTGALLGSQDQFRYLDGEQDMTFVRVEAGGIRHGRKTRVLYQLIDRRDLKTGLTSMQRTVGFTLSLGARLILEGKLRAGLLTPLDVPYDLVFPALERHDIRVTRTELPG